LQPIEKVDQFNPTSARDHSPKIRSKGNEDQISQLLAQLQAPMDMMPDEKQNFDIEKAHHHMQESIKQMKLNDPFKSENEGSLPMGAGFNGQNSLYELA